MGIYTDENFGVFSIMGHVKARYLGIDKTVDYTF